MNEKQIELLKALFKAGYDIEWWDSIDSIFRPILGFTQATGEIEANFDECMNAQFIICEHPFSVVDFYDADINDFFLASRSRIFKS